MVEVDVSVPYHYEKEDLIRAVVSVLPKTEGQILDVFPTKRTLSVTDSAVTYKMTVAVALPEEVESGVLKKKKTVRLYDPCLFSVPKAAPKKRPLVVGLGPAGLFCALALCEAGACPLVIERGLDVEKRKKAVNAYLLGGKLDPNSNVQFGEGGAGAFSDGKLKAGKNDKYKMKVLREFVSAGAPEEILYETAAHLGTDKLPDIVRTLREKIISLGGTVRFSTKLKDLCVRDGRLTAAVFETPQGEEIFETDTVFLCTGHSAHDVFTFLQKDGIAMTAKPFGIGLRIEHPRETVNRWVYGDRDTSGLPTASYHLVSHLPNGRSTYSFCMCPGGEVMAATTEPDGVVTNGMSNFARDGRNSNAALLVSVFPEDFQKYTENKENIFESYPNSDKISPLGGFAMQREIEKAAFVAGGGTGAAPACRLEDFMKNRSTDSFGEVLPTFPKGTAFAAPDAYLPSFITDTLRLAIPEFDAWIPGFYAPDAVLTGAETRSTSPVRVERNADTLVSVSCSGLYPVGEGAGYSGGIVTSAMDGLKCAESYLLKFLSDNNSF